MSATPHFRQRVRERIGNVDPDHLAEGLVWAIENHRNDLVQFAGRTWREGKRRRFLFRVPDGRKFYAIMRAEHGNHVPITVLEAA